MQPALNIAIAAARKAGEILLQYREKLDHLQVTKKAHHDYVSEVDLRVEQTIIQILSKAYPQYGFIAEETGIIHEDAQEQWIIDPLDGTTNYLHGHPAFCVSIALRIKQQLECGVIFDPLRQECFVAARGQGARLNDRRLRVSKTMELSEALLGTNFSFSMPPPNALDPSFQQLAQITAGTRRTGAAALDLAYVASGRLDAFLGSVLKIWDLAAGALLILEAGGFVSDLYGQPDYLKEGHILAGNAKIFRAMSQIIQ